MTREPFHMALQQLQEGTLVMASMVESAIHRAMCSLVRRDLKLALNVVSDDEKVNHQCYGIQEACAHLIITQQPMASDARRITAPSDIVAHLELIGDHAKGIANISVIMVQEEVYFHTPQDIYDMSELVGSMLCESMEAFISQDDKRARQVATEVVRIDGLYDHIYSELRLNNLRSGERQ